MKMKGKCLTAAAAIGAGLGFFYIWFDTVGIINCCFGAILLGNKTKNTVLFSMSGKRRGNGPFKMTLAQQARTMSYYNPAIKKENFLTADRNGI